MSRGEGPGTGAHGTVRPGALGTCMAGVSVVWMGLWALGLVGARRGAQPRRAESASCGRWGGSPGAEWGRADR